MSLWWVEYSGRRTLIEADNVDAADDAAIRRFGRIPDSVYMADEDPDLPSLRTGLRPIPPKGPSPQPTDP